MNRSVIILIVCFLIYSKVTAQGFFEIGYQQNALQKTNSFAGSKSYSVQATIGTHFNNVPIYAGWAFQNVFITDDLLKENKYNGFLGGIKLGIRPLANIVLFPIQPFFEGSYYISLGKKNPSIKNIYNYGGGIEIYFTKKASIAFTYSLDNYLFDTKDVLANNSGKISIRIN